MDKNRILINRMSVERINLLLSGMDKYPTVTQSCIDDMMKNTSWMDLKYETICTLNDVFGVGYNPTAISSLFEDIK
jgi:hypothetical protein